MKKIVGIIALFFLIVSSFGFVNAESESSYTGTYESTDKDGKILNKLKPRLEKIQKKKPKVLLRLNKRIEKILPKLKEDSRRYYLVFMLNEMIISIINEEDDTSSILDDILEGEYEIEEEDNNEEESEDEETEEDTNEEEDSDEDESGEDEDDSEDEENNNSEDDETSENDETEEDEEEICVISGGDLISLLPNGLDITEDNIEVDIAEWNFDSAIDCEQVDDFHVDFGELNELAEISGVDDVECELIVKDNNLTEIDHIDLDMNGSSQVFDIDGLYINAGNNTLTFGLSCDIEHSVSVSGTFDIEMEFDNASMESSESGDENNVDLTDYELDMDIDVNVNIQ